MIDRLVGTVVGAAPGRVVLDVHGVGYAVLVPVREAERLPVGATPVTLHVHVVYGEDQRTAFGFLAARERDAYRELIGVAGVGPRTGMALLSGMTLGELRDAVLREDRKALLKVSGVGAKLAGRLLLELKDRALAWAAEPAAAAATGPAADDERAVASLTGLGYKAVQAARAVEVARAKLGADASFEDVLRRALQEAVG